MTRLGPPRSRYTKTPNDYLDQSARAGASLPARHRSIVDLLVRELLGWHADALAISQRAIAHRLGISDRTLREAVGDLERWRVVRRRGAGRGRIAIWELVDPRQWRISRTAGAIRAAERRRLAGGGAQPLLPFSDVASVLDLPTQIRVRTRDRTGDIPRGWAAALVKKRKKSKGGALSQPRGTVRLALSRPGDRMPNDEPQRPTALEMRQIRRFRAARARVRRLDPTRAFDQALLDWTAKGLTEAEIDEELQLRDAETEQARERQRQVAQAEAMLHERSR